MKIYALSVLSAPGGSALMLSSASDLSSFSFYHRRTVSEFFAFFSVLIAKQTSPGERQGFTDVDGPDSDFVFYVYNYDGGNYDGDEPHIAAVIVTDKEYPRRSAFSVLTNTLETFSTKIPAFCVVANPSSIEFPDLEEYLTRFQDPRNADSIVKLQQDFDETEIGMHHTIEYVLARGETLDDLVARSDRLGVQSKRFYAAAKQPNAYISIN